MQGTDEANSTHDANSQIFNINANHESWSLELVFVDGPDYLIIQE